MFISLTKDNTNIYTESNRIGFVVEQEIITKRVKLSSASIPLSYYLINNNNKTFYLYESESPYAEGDTSSAITINMTPGNYTASTLATHIKTILDNATTKSITYTVSYSTITGKFTISTATADRKFYLASVSTNKFFTRILGFVYGTDYFANSKVLANLGTTFTGGNKGDVSGIRQLYITTTLPIKHSYYLDSNILKGRQILAIVNVIYNSDNIIYSLEQQNLFVGIPEGKIPHSNFYIEILDDEFNSVDFEGVNYILNLYCDCS